MHTLRTGIGIGWIVFWAGWLLAAASAKESVHGRRVPVGGLGVVAAVILLRVLDRGSLLVHSHVLGGVGAVLFVCGLALAVWARLILGRDWGMPMTQRADPELVTGGPYGLIRHPIYSGLLLAMLGTALATSLVGLALVAVLAVLFVYSASVEERNLTATFPSAYPAYCEHTKMLIPYVL
jgi:protein-S-isoprenylcysteine O-methyltransferase Ste14